MNTFKAKLRRRQLDQILEPYKNVPRFRSGYVREIRDALEMTSYQLAERLGIKQPSVMEIEKNERGGSITLKTLERAASALGCKLVYAIVPNTSLDNEVREQAKARSEELSQAISRTMALEHQSTDAKELGAVIEELTQDILNKGGRELWKRIARRHGMQLENQVSDREAQVKAMIVEQLHKAEKLLQGHKVYLYGSRAEGTARPRSDFDIGISGKEPISLKAFYELEDMMEELPTLYKIDLVDLNRTSAEFQKGALEQAQLLYAGKDS